MLSCSRILLRLAAAGEATDSLTGVTRADMSCRRVHGKSKRVESAALLLTLPDLHLDMTPIQLDGDVSEYLINLEESFYQQGMANGLPHGHLHGLFEGRSLGREKGWEMWEEVGYYQGTATFWRAVLLSQGKQGIRYVRSSLRRALSQLILLALL